MTTSPPFIQISAQAARRFLLDVQGLGTGARRRVTQSRIGGDNTPPSPRPARVLNTIRRLECVQIDPVAAVERNQHLVLAARLPGYTPTALDRLLASRKVFEYWANAACVIPIDDYPIFEGIRRRRRRRAAEELARLRPVVDAVLARVASDGPMPARAFAAEDRVHGWWDNTRPRTKATSHALTLLWSVGAVTVVRREGIERYFDLPERAVPGDLLEAAARITTADADNALLGKYMRAYRIFDPGDPRFSWRRVPVAERRKIINRCLRSGTVVPLHIEGIRRAYYMLAEDLDRLRVHERAIRRDGGRCAAESEIRFLPPLDNLLWRRERVSDLFGFEYTWEIYVPQAKRRDGYYVMPILAGDRLIGRMDPRLDRSHGRLVVRLLRLEPGIRPTRRLGRALADALEAFAHFHGAQAIRVERADPGLKL